MRPTDNEIERQRGAFASLASRAAGGRDCPEPRELWDAATGRMPTERIRQLVEHTVTCPGCAEDWRLARELGRETVGGVARFPARRAGRRVRWALAAAAVLVALIAIPLWRGRAPVDAPELVRASGEQAPVHSLLADDVVLPRTDCVLRWSLGARQADSYDLLVSTEELEILIDERGLEEPRYRVPAAALERVPAGGEIFWRVEAKLVNGDRATSPTFVNEVE